MSFSDEIKRLEDEFLLNKKKVNNFPKILKIATQNESDFGITSIAITSLRSVLNFISRTPELQIEKLAKWFAKQIKKTDAYFLRILHSNDARLQARAFEALFERFTAMSSEKISKESVELLKQILAFALTSPNYEGIGETLCHVCSQFQDLHIWFLRCFEEVTAKPQKMIDRVKFKLDDPMDNVIRNMLDILSSIDLDDVIEDILIEPSEPPKKKRKLETFRKRRAKFLNQCWLNYLALPLPLLVYDDVLANMVEAIMPVLTTPLMLSDFLSDSFKIGGSISLLALEGLWALIQKHNLDFPDFYPKLYTLLNPVMLHVQNRSKFLDLLTTFLSSSHLPDYLVVSFTKRLVWLQLRAPAEVMCALATLIANLVRRYPVCKELVQRPPPLPKADGSEKVEYCPKDSFDISCDDMQKSGAETSSLWELRTLEKHFAPSVSKTCSAFSQQKFIQNIGMKTRAPDVKKHLDTTYKSMIASHRKRKKGSNVLEFRKREKFLSGDALFQKCFAF